jgi:hypothetical protein
MSCDAFLRSLGEALPVSRSMRAHAAMCARCRPLLEVDDALRAEPLASAPAMSPALLDALAAARPVRVRYTALGRALLPAAVVVTTVGLVAFFARRPDFARVPAWLVVVAAAGFLGTFAVGLALLFARGRAGRGPSAAARVGFLLAALAAYAALSVLTVESVPGAPPRRPVQDWLAAEIVPVLGGWVRHAPCTLLGLVVGGAVAAALLRAAARTAVSSPRTAGAVVGATAAMGTAFTFFAYCPSHELFHVALVHALPLLSVVAGAAALGRRVLAP